MRYLDSLKEVFWSPSFWLPLNSTWENFQPDDGHRYPRIEDIYLAWSLVPVIIATKYILEKHVFVKVAASLGIREKPKGKLPDVDILESAFRTNTKGKWSELQLTQLSKQLDWSTEQILNWLRKRKALGTPTLTEKFAESSWRVCVYLCLFTFGMSNHWSEDWFWDAKLFWKSFPQPVSDASRWYFLLTTTNYSSWTISHFTDVQRKDPWLMLYHHVVTVTSLYVSWMSNFHRWFILVLLVHDVGDILIETSKLLKYLGFTITCKMTFLLCTIFWIMTRDIIFPFYLIPSCFYNSPHHISQMFPFKNNCSDGSCDLSSFKFTATHLLLLILCSLFALHIYWTVLILRILFVAQTTGKLEDDVVSEDDDDEEDKTDHGSFHCSTMTAFSNFSGQYLSFPRFRDKRFYQHDR